MSETTEPNEYEVVVVGGGPAGMTAALYTTRLGHRTAVVNRGGGRAAMMQNVHNVLGVTEDTSGAEFLEVGTEQLREYGCDVYRDAIASCRRVDPADGDTTDRDATAGDTAEPESRRDDEPAAETVTFELATGGQDGETFHADAVVLATGFDDVRPEPPLPRTGRGLHYCLHCDAYMFVGEPVYVMGRDESAAHVAAIMLNFTDDVDLLTRGDDPQWSEATAEMLDDHPIDVVHEDVTGVRNGDDGWLEALEFEDTVGPRPTSSRTESGDGSVREYAGGFAMYGAEYNNGLARDLGCDITAEGAIEVDDHGRTSVDGVYAVGDVTPGHNQVPVALGEGAKAGIAAHFTLRDFPRDPALIEEQGPVRSEEVPGIPDALLEQAVDHHTYD